MRRIVLLGALALITVQLGLVATESTSQAATPSKASANYSLDTTEPTTLGGYFPLPKRPPSEHVCFEENGNSLQEEFQQGVTAAAAALGWQLTIITINQAVPSSYGTGITSSEQANCNAVIVVASNYSNYSPQIASAVADHMVIEDTDSDNNVPQGVITSLRTSLVQSRVGQAEGRSAGTDAEKRYHGKATVLTSETPQFIDISQPLVAGQRMGLEQTCPTCKLDVISVDLSVTLGPDPSGPFVTAVQTDPSIKYVLAVSSSPLPSAFTQAGLSVPRFYGADPGLNFLQNLETSNPDTYAWADQPSIVFGWYMIDSLARSFDHMKVTNPWNTAATSPPVWVIDHANVKSFLAQNQNFPKNYQALFKKMWRI